MSNGRRQTAALRVLKGAAHEAGRTDPAPFRLETHVFYMLTQIILLRNRALNADLKASGIDYQRWRILAVLNEMPSCSMQRLAELTSVDRTTLVHTVNLMVAEGTVARDVRSNDKRSVSLDLTSEGRKLFATVVPLVQTHTEHALRSVSPREREQLMRLLSRIRDDVAAG